MATWSHYRLMKMTVLLPISPRFHGTLRSSAARETEVAHRMLTRCKEDTHDLPTRLYLTRRDGGTDRRRRARGALPEAIHLLINAALLLERQHFSGAGPYQRTPERHAHANGFKDKTVQTRVGAISVAVPHVREGGFYPQSLEQGVRSERALKLALAEMYIQGVSTRVARLFPHEASCLRLVTAVVMEISEEWETGKAYLIFEQ
jgi:transposase-like protein